MKGFNHESGNTLSIGGAVIYYEVLENPGKPILLLLHGGGGNIEDLNSMLPYLQDSFHIIGIDSRGHGRSSIGNSTLTYERLQQDVEAILTSLQINKVNIIGFSDGGIIGYRMAAESTIRVEKLVTIGGTWSTDDIRATEELLKGFSVELWQTYMPASFEIYQKLNPEKDAQRTLEQIKSMWIDESPTGYPNEKVKLITCPTLIIRGDSDRLFLRESAVKLANNIENASLFNIPFANHGAFDDQKEIFQLILNQFLNQETN